MTPVDNGPGDRPASVASGDLAGDIGGVAGPRAPSSLTSVVSYVNAAGRPAGLARRLHRRQAGGQIGRRRVL